MNFRETLLDLSRIRIPFPGGPTPLHLFASAVLFAIPVSLLLVYSDWGFKEKAVAVSAASILFFVLTWYLNNKLGGVRLKDRIEHRLLDAVASIASRYGLAASPGTRSQGTAYGQIRFDQADYETIQSVWRLRGPQSVPQNDRGEKDWDFACAYEILLLVENILRSDH